MEALDIVLKNYDSASKDYVAGHVQRKRVTGKPQSDAEQIIKTDLPTALLDEIERSGRDPLDYRVYGSVGQINFPFARIPWVASLHREISTSTERGYYIVLLFREDMGGCVLSLNQGYTQYKDAFGTDTLAAAKILESATVALTYLDLPSNVIAGPIDLAATGNLGIGYERGAIASFEYLAHAETTTEGFLNDFSILLHAYDVLRERIGPNIVDAAAPPTEDDFQEAATALSRPSKSKAYKPPPDGPVAPPAKSPLSGGSRFKRDPRISGAAISAAAYLCEVDIAHVSFIARTTKKNFVEAHHLIPLQFQEQFAAGLDVIENIVALCPMCHRKLHHGQVGEKSEMLLPLLAGRTQGLKGRGLTISSEQLVSFYRAKVEEE